MNGFKVERYVDSEGKENTKFLNLNEKEVNQWKKDIEARALSEFYNKKIKILN